MPHGKYAEIPYPSAAEVEGWLAEPEGRRRGGVVVIQEWWGLNDQNRRTADRLAGQGYAALAPDLRREQSTYDRERAGHLLEGLDWKGATYEDLRGAAVYLKDDGGRVAGLGFCAGSALAITAGVRISEAGAVVCFYGISPVEQVDPAVLRGPFIRHVASRGDWIKPEMVDARERTLSDAGVVRENHRYEADHGFFDEDQPKHDAIAVVLAWERTLAFLDKQVS